MLLGLLFCVVGMNAQVYYELEQGWQLLGINNASVNMNDFNKSAVKTVWAYDKVEQKWKLYSPDATIMQQVSGMDTIKPLTQLDDKMGFWVLADAKTSLLVNTQSNNIPLANCYPAVNTQAPVTQYVPIERYTEYTDSVDTTNKIKWYGLDGGTIGHTYYVSLTSIATPSSNDDLYIQAYDDLGNLMNPDYIGAAGISYMYAFTLRAGTKLYFKIYGGSSTAGSYSYKFKVYPGLADGLQQDPVTFEPNDYQAIAYPVELQKEYVSQLLKTGDRQDWFVLPTVTKGNDYYIKLTSNITSSSTYNDLFIMVYDDLGTLLSEDYISAAGTTFTWQVKPNISGKLYFRLRGESTNEVYDYKFEVRAL